MRRVLPKPVILLPVLVAFIASGLPVSAEVDFDVNAEAAILVDAATGQVLFAKNEDKQLQPASITKIMTMLLAMEAVRDGRASLQDKVVASANAEKIGGSQVFLRSGETFTLEKMLEAVAIASANDAAYAIAEHLAGTEANFVAAMNRRARELGMKQTQFINSTGLPPDPGQEPDLSSAADIVIMSRELINYPEVLKWCSTWQKPFRDEPEFILYNTNHLIKHYPGMDGLKTGHTDAAGWCLAATAKRGPIRLLSVVLNAPSVELRWSETAKLLDYGYRNFSEFVATVAGTSLGKARIQGGRQEEVEVVAAEDLKVLARKGMHDRIQERLVLDEGVKAPVEKGQVLGKLVVTQNDLELGTVDAVAAASVPRANIFTIFIRWLRDIIRSIFVAGKAE